MSKLFYVVEKHYIKLINHIQKKTIMTIADQIKAFIASQKIEGLISMWIKKLEGAIMIGSQFELGDKKFYISNDPKHRGPDEIPKEIEEKLEDCLRLLTTVNILKGMKDEEFIEIEFDKAARNPHLN